ncbi:MAG: phosphorylase [Acholeplasmataceae bacterium]|nr:MAG: phosphorylase [Acholeplasmataceae bacterium]
MPMKSVLTRFDPTRKALIEPTEVVKPVAGFPRICLFAFSRQIIEKVAARPEVKEIDALYSANGRIPIYQMDYKGTTMAITMAAVGAPLCVGFAEEVIAKGADILVFFGACGVLRPDLADGHIVIPDRALRDEGTSYHYAPAADVIDLDPDVIKKVTQVFQRLDVPCVTGMTWTTDAFYRETPAKTRQRREQGCIVVDMEVSALAAMAAFRNVTYAQFLYTGDLLGETHWEARDLADQGMSKSDLYIKVACEIGLALSR